jgi:hypothetical protein
LFSSDVFLGAKVEEKHHKMVLEVEVFAKKIKDWVTMQT